MPTSQSQTADDIIKKCQDVGEKFIQVGGDANKNNEKLHPNMPISTNAADRVHYLHELPLAAEERYADIFRQLDRNGK